MSLHFSTVKIKEIRKETGNCISILFDIPEELKNIFEYKSGQHITLRKFINGEDTRRSYSLCSTPLSNEWRIAVKKVGDGFFSAYANEQLKKGDTIELMPPMGNFFTVHHPSNKKNYAAIAAGSGITPVISIIKTVLATEPQSSFTLVYGNRNRSSIIFKEELEALKNKYLERLSVIHVLSREMTDAAINHGRIDPAKCAQLFDKAVSLHADEFFLCGPEEMIFCIKDFLLTKGVDKKKIHFELFTAAGQQRETANVRSEKKNDEHKSKITVKLDGISFDFDLAFDDVSILDAALQNGAELPYSCKGGVCCTCRARLLEGEVNMDVCYALEPEEVEQGFILCCQSHPKTEKVVVDFDIK